MKRTAERDQSCLSIQKEALDRTSLQSELKISRGLPTELLDLKEEEVPLSEVLHSSFVPAEFLPAPEDYFQETTEEAPELLSPEEQLILKERRAIQDSLFPEEFMIVNEKDNLAIAWASTSLNEATIIFGYDELSCGFTALSDNCLTRNCVFLSAKKAPKYSFEKNHSYSVGHDNLSTLPSGKRERMSRGWIRVCLGKF